MKLQTKLTLWFAGLLLLVAATLLLTLHMISGKAAESTAAATLEAAVARYAVELDSGRGRGRDFKGRTYDDGAYLLVYGADGSELLAGTDVFGIQARMPGLLLSGEQDRVFRLAAEEAELYCYIRWIAGPADLRDRFSREETSWEPEASGELPVSGEAMPSDGMSGEAPFSEEAGGVWIVGLLPEDSMENVMGSVVNYACIGLPIIVLLAALGGWAIAGRALRPLRKITESAREISDGHDLSRRIELTPGKDEVHELADTFNDMMGRLERSFEAERQFTSDASHELRTPTTVILAECEMAEKMPEDTAAVQESVAEIRRQARKMSELVGKLLSYTRLEQGTRRIDREPLDLAELAADVCAEQRAVTERDIAIECEAEPDVTVSGDAALLISLVQNLVTNAVKYGKDGGHVWVRAYRDGANACVSVRDDGIGIAEEDLDRIWNRFFQADRSRSDERRGVGLGLSLAQQIARLHGGTITARSVPGEGSEFVFSMPQT